MDQTAEQEAARMQMHILKIVKMLRNTFIVLHITNNTLKTY